MMWADDRDEFPMVAAVDLTFSGGFDRPAFEAAARNAVARHPLLSARIQPKKWRCPSWVLDDREPGIDWGSLETPPNDDAFGAIDLTRRAGLHLAVRNFGSTFSLQVRLHHACCDGVAIFQFLEDLLAGYSSLVTSTAPNLSLRPLQPALLRTRGRFPLVSSGLREWTSDTRVGLRETWKFTRVDPVALAGPRRAGKSPGGRHGCAELRAGPALLAELRRAAAGRHTTLNDLLLATLFLAIRDWNDEYGHPNPNDSIRILMPCNLRGPDHEAMPATNYMSYAFLTRQVKDCGEPTTLLPSVKRETEFIRTTNASLMFIRGLHVASRVPGTIRRMTPEDRCLATAVLSNMSDPTRSFAAPFPRERGKLVVGDAVLEEILAWTPLRPLTRAGLIITTYASQLSITAKCDPHVFSNASADEFLATYRTRLEAYL